MTALLGATATILAFALARALQVRTKLALLHPVLLAVAALVAGLELFDIPYTSYRQGGDLVGFFLGPSVVALGVALHLQLPQIVRRGKALLVAIGVGSVVGVVTAAGTARLLGASDELVATLAPKSVTTPIAMGIAEKLGGIPAITAVLVIAVGAFGAMVGPWFLRRIGVRSPGAVGLALGAAAHGLGTARAIEEGELEGASAGLAIGLMGVATAVAAPLLLLLL